MFWLNWRKYGSVLYSSNCNLYTSFSTIFLAWTIIQWSHMSSNNTHNYPITLIIPPVSSTSTAPSIISDEVIIIWHAASSLSVHSGRFCKKYSSLIGIITFSKLWNNFWTKLCFDRIFFYLVIICNQVIIIWHAVSCLSVHSEKFAQTITILW